MCLGMRISTAMSVAVVVLAGVVAGATTRSREAPSPSEKSRANDTPVVDHMPGGGPSGGAVVGLAIVADRPGTVFAAFEHGGVFRSHDYGTTWTAADRGLPADTACELRAVPAEPATLYAACDDDLFKTTDAGRRWERVSPNIPLDCHGGLTIHPAEALSLFCVGEDGVSSSRDGGRTWVRLDVDTAHGASSEDAGQDAWESLAFVGNTGDVLTALRGDRIVRSRDAGEHWEPLATSIPAGIMPAPFAVDPLDPWTAYVGTARGVMVTRDFGQTWTRRSAGISRIAVSVALHEGPTAMTLYATSSAWSDAAEMFASTDGGETWEIGVPSSMPLDADARTLRSDGAGGLTMNAGGQYHHLRRGQAGWLPLDLPADARLLNVDLASQASPLVAAGPDGYLLSDDSGRSWQRGRLPGAWGPSAAAATVGRGRVLFMSTMALPFITGTAALPTNRGTWRSLDDGRTWEPTGPLLDMPRFETVQADPHADGTVFVSATAIDSDRAVIHRSTDRGETWKELHVPLAGRAVP